MSTIIDSIEKEQLRPVPRFEAGDRVRVHFQVIEGSRTRTQVFEGVVIKRQGSGARETFTVRKQSFGVGVERTFPVHSPKVERLEVAARGDVRRAKLYYLRDRVGKAARVAERRWGITDDVLVVEEEGAADAEGSQVEAEVEVTELPEEGEDAEGAEGEAAGEPEAEGPDEQSAPEADAEAPVTDADDAIDEGADTEADERPQAGDGESEGDSGAEEAEETEQAQAGGSEGGSTEAEASKQGG